MKSIADVVQEIQELHTKTTDAVDSQTGMMQQRMSAIDELAKRIRAGETTGDNLVDFYIVKYGLHISDLTATTPLHRVREKMRCHIGEPVLVVSRREVFVGCTGFGHQPRPHEYTLEISMLLGLLTEGEYQLTPTKDKIFVPVGGSYARLFDQRDLGVITQDIQATYFVDIDVPLYCKNGLNIPPGVSHLMQREVLVGHADIDAWLELPQSQGFRQKVYMMARRLGFSIEVSEKRRAVEELETAEVQKEITRLLERQREGRMRVIRAIEAIDRAGHHFATRVQDRELVEARAILRSINQQLAKVIAQAQHLGIECDTEAAI